MAALLIEIFVVRVFGAVNIFGLFHFCELYAVREKYETDLRSVVVCKLPDDVTLVSKRVAVGT